MFILNNSVIREIGILPARAYYRYFLFKIDESFQYAVLPIECGECAFDIVRGGELYLALTVVAESGRF